MIELLRIPVQDRPGQLYEVVTALAEADIDMKALCLMHHHDGQGELLLLVTDLLGAREALGASGRAATIQAAVVVEVADQTGGLAAVLKATTEAGLSINDLFTFVTRLEGKALAVATFEDNASAERRLREAGLHLLDQPELGAIAPAPQAPHQLVDYLGGSFFW